MYHVVKIMDMLGDMCCARIALLVPQVRFTGTRTGDILLNIDAISAKMPHVVRLSGFVDLPIKKVLLALAPRIRSQDYTHIYWYRYTGRVYVLYVA